MELKRCPLCGGQTMLCQNVALVTSPPEFSVICLECGVEFKMRYDPLANVIFDPAEAAKKIIDKFNRRATSSGKEDA